jgi:hypothetical protein
LGTNERQSKYPLGRSVGGFDLGDATMNPACKTFVPMLSPFIDGELSPSERVTVERHLTACKECTMRAADLRAESGLVRVGMEMLADEVDFKDFSQKVMARITPERPPLGERISLFFSELFTYQRKLMFTSLATAAAVLLVATPIILRGGPQAGYASERMMVDAVKIDDGATVAPVVMETKGGDTIIWMVEKADPTQTKDGSTDPDDGESDEEDFRHEAPAPLNTKKAPEGGEL